MAARTKPGKPQRAASFPQLWLIRPPVCPPHALRERGDEIGYGGHGLGGRAPLGIEAAVQGINQRGADHRAVGVFGDRPRRLGRADAETDADRQFGVPLDAGNGFADCRRNRRWRCR